MTNKSKLILGVSLIGLIALGVFMSEGDRYKIYTNQQAGKCYRVAKVATKLRDTFRFVKVSAYGNHATVHFSAESRIGLRLRSTADCSFNDAENPTDVTHLRVDGRPYTADEINLANVLADL